MPTISCVFVLLGFVSNVISQRKRLHMRLTCVAFARRLSDTEKKPSSEAVAEYLEERKKYEELRQQKRKKGSNREEQVTSRSPNFSPWSRSVWDCVKAKMDV